MNKFTLLFVVPWTIACQSIAGMDTQGLLIPLSKEQLKVIIDQQEKDIIILQNTNVSIAETLRIIHDTNQATQILAERVHSLEQQLHAHNNSTIKKIASHPGTWLALIALYYVATKYYEYKHKEKAQGNLEQDVNLDEQDEATNSPVTNQET